MQPAGPLTADAVIHYFELILGRRPESDAVVRHYLGMSLTADAFARVLMDSDEVTERYRRRIALGDLREQGGRAPWSASADATRVMLFGAYGNGNLGDTEQAEAVAWVLGRLLPGPLCFGASSWERAAPFGFESGVVLPHDALLRPDLLDPARADAARLLVMGGGGLLGAPHFPLHMEAWTAWLAGRGVPWALLGIGGSPEALATPAWRTPYRTLIERAAFVGVRDAATLAAAQAINPAAIWFPDPILIRGLLTVPPKPAKTARPIDMVIIPRGPNGPADARANQSALAYRHAAVQAGKRVTVVALEGRVDAAALRGEEVVYVEDWAALMRLCEQARVVASLRLHGVIAGIAAGCVVHGMVQPKIGDLMHALGVGDWFAPDGWPSRDPDGGAADSRRYHAALRPRLLEMRARIDGAMDRASRAMQAALGSNAAAAR